jgi:hypothetical protein
MNRDSTKATGLGVQGLEINSAFVVIHIYRQFSVAGRLPDPAVTANRVGSGGLDACLSPPLGSGEGPFIPAVTQTALSSCPRID